MSSDRSTIKWSERRAQKPSRSDNTDARYCQDAQGTGTEHLQAGSFQTGKDHGHEHGVSLVARSKGMDSHGVTDAASRFG